LPIDAVPPPDVPPWPQRRHRAGVSPPATASSPFVNKQNVVGNKMNDDDDR
jgi:hypothetical protein